MGRDSVRLKSVIALWLLLAVSSGIAHEKHGDDSTDGKVVDGVTAKLINESYLKDVKPIFERACFDCHSQQTKYPWYHKIPGVKQLIESDIKEGLEHIDFEPGFPFKSHAAPSEDLDEILEVIEKNDMPPVSYRIMHPGSKLTNEEKKAIKKWIQNAKAVLERTPESKTKSGL